LRTGCKSDKQASARRSENSNVNCFEAGLIVQVLQDFPIIDGQGHSAGDFPADILISKMKELGAVILRNVACDKYGFIALTERIAPGVERGVAPNSNGLEFHGEAYYTPWPPDVLWFYCVQPPEIDGQTLLCDGVKLASLLSPNARAFFHRNGLVYEMAFEQSEWASYFKTENRDEVMNQLEAFPSIRARFAGDTLHTRYTTYAIRQTKWGNAPAFINSLLHALDSTQRTDIGDYGLRTEIPPAILSELQGWTTKFTYSLEWKHRDIVMIDNTRVMHARRPFRGRREIIAVNGKARF